MDRSSLLTWWNDAWTGGLWAVPWSKALDGLSAQQAAWKPAIGRHSIWQNVNHMLFWREHAVRVLAGEKVPKEEIERRNFEEPRDPAAGAWDALRRRFAESHQQLAGLMADPSKSLERLQFILPHDTYHLGQIMFLRSLQGLPPIE
jgi:uncharacterized damage-inducible protein DinB